jgi:hypothetical protein
MTQRGMNILGIFIACMAALGFCGCAMTEGSRTALADRFRVESAAPPEAFAAHQEVTRSGHRKDAMRLIAPLRIRLSLGEMPQTFKLTMQVTPVFNIGDGMQLDFLVGKSGESHPVAGRYFDAARIAADRAWVPMEVTVDSGGEAGAYLEIRLSGGPQGDLVADWLAIADLRVVG